MHALRLIRVRFAPALAIALSLAILSAGCERATSSADGGVAVDLALMAFLSQARAVHHEANVREAGGDAKGAILALEGLTAARRPDGARPEVAELMADTFARLAELRARSGDVDGAGRDLEAGLAQAPARSYFEGHLYEVAGIVSETKAKQLADAGQESAAAEARGKAIDLLRKAVAIQEEVIRSTLAADAGPRKAP